MKVSSQYTGCAYICCQSRGTIFAMRPRMCEARCGTCTQGKIKNRVLYASNPQIAFACFRAPTDETIAARQVPRRRTPCQARDHLAFRRNQILQMFADRLLIAKIVILLQQAVEQRLLRGAPHLLKLQHA